jgi:hypothetical protein
MVRLPDAIHVPVTVTFDGGLVIGPGDVLVIKLPVNISEQAFDDVKERIMAWLPDEMHHRVLLVPAEEIAKLEGGRVSE